MKTEKLFELSRLLLPEDPSLEAEVRNSLSHPDDSISFIRKEIGNWVNGVDIFSSLPWYTLIAGLHNRGLMFELSSQTVAKGLDYYTNQILREIGCIAGDSTNSNDAVNLIQSFLEITGEHLLAANYLLGEFHLECGISTITMIPQHVAKQATTLVQESGYGEMLLHPNTSSKRNTQRFALLTTLSSSPEHLTQSLLQETLLNPIDSSQVNSC